MTTTRSPKKRVAPVFLGVVLSAMLAGCGGAPEGPPPPPPLQNQEEIVAHLPPGVTLDTPIVPNELFGEKTKTVGEALASLHARVQGKQLVDGGMGQPIRIQKPGEKPSKRAKRSPMTITIAE